MKISHLIGACSLLIASVLLGCTDYDDTSLRQDVNDLKDRVSALENWRTTANQQISALEDLVEALEAKDYVTGVTPVTENGQEVGYTISFTKSNPITIRHGKQGDPGVTPIIGVKKDTDEIYYWTVKSGSAEPQWLLDGSGAKIPTTGDRGATPVISVAEFEGELYWQVDGEWLLNGTAKVPTTGEQGDAVFAENGVDYTSDPNNVTFTLADGVTKITLPRAETISVGFESTEPYYCSTTNNKITIVLPQTLKQSDYIALTARVSNSAGSDFDTQTRAIPEGQWGIQITKPTFTNGVINPGSAYVTVTLPQDRFYYKALLSVSLIDANGKEHSAHRLLWIEVDEAENVVKTEAGSLSSKVTAPESVTELSVVGDLNADDFQFIREQMTSLEWLDLSRCTITALPRRALAFYNTMDLSSNTTLKTVLLPEGLTEIGDSAFAMCLNLQRISMPAGVRTFGRWMFEECTNLKNVEIPAGVTEIPASAFYHAGVQKVVLPASVTTVGAYAFDSCPNLESITLSPNMTEIPEMMCYTCPKLKELVFYNGIETIGDDAFCICPIANDLVFPASVKRIGNRAFSAAKSSHVTFSEGLESIGAAAFNNMENLTEVVLPASLKSLNDGAFFWYQPYLKRLTFRGETPPEITYTYDPDGNLQRPDLRYMGSCDVYVPSRVSGAYKASVWGAGSMAYGSPRMTYFNPDKIFEIFE